MTDKNDVTLKNWQDNLNYYEDATSIAVETLEKLGVIYQDENGKWHHTDKYFNIKGSFMI